MVDRARIELARNILNVDAGATKDELKRRYRQLLHLVHPDANPDRDVYPYTVYEIREAYEILCRNSVVQASSKKKKVHTWDARENENARYVRPIYQYAYDSDGEIIGIITLTTGKYYYCIEEDFPLFLKSIRSLLPENFTPEMYYNLAVEYMDSFFVLDELFVYEESSKGNIYTVPAMMELTDSSTFYREGDLLFPRTFKNHRLYLSDEKEKIAGYLSFQDDRLYYILIPLFEKRAVQVKFVVKKHEKRRKYVDIILYVRKK